MKRVRLLIEGRVQGVCFRHFTNQEADRLGVVGWVRNLSDGRVEVMMEGSPGAVDLLIDWCRQGPPHAQVSRVESYEEKPTGEFESFRITG